MQPGMNNSMPIPPLRLRCLHEVFVYRMLHFPILMLDLAITLSYANTCNVEGDDEVFASYSEVALKL